jgi:hypothetical protein
MDLLLALILAAYPAAAGHHNEQQDPLLSRLTGEWTGTGTVLDQPSTIRMSWTWELGGQFLRLTFRNEMGAAPKLRVFEGHAYYRALGDGRYRGMWFDNAGMFRPLDARRDGDSLVSRWGTADTEEGETTYRLRDDGIMDVVDRVKGKDGTWRTFGTATYTRH